MVKRQWLVYAGYVPPVLFWTTNVWCGILLPNYNHATALVSELGELGTPTQQLFTTGLVLCSFFSVLFMAGLYQTAKAVGISVVPVLLIAVYSLSILGAALFPFPSKMHELLGMPAIVLFLSPLTAFVLWKGSGIPNIQLFSLIALAMMLFAFSVYIPRVLPAYFGIKQRFFHAGWTIWFLYLSNTFSSLRINTP